MTKIKSFYVNNGDMFYMYDDANNLTIIDCNLVDERTDSILGELKSLQDEMDTHITRFISTHPDEDHIKGIEQIFDVLKINDNNMYIVDNDISKENPTESFKYYKNNRNKYFHLEAGMKRLYLNDGDKDYAPSNISVIWPVLSNKYFKEALSQANNGSNDNNISPIIRYSNGFIKILWFGDLETEYLDNISNYIDDIEADIVFAPHHGRKSGKIPQSLLKKINPKIIIIGSGPSEYLNYYKEYNHITQNTAQDITLVIEYNSISFYSSNPQCKVDFLTRYAKYEKEKDYYLGTLTLYHN